MRSAAQRWKSQPQTASGPGGADRGRDGAAEAVAIAGVDREAYSGDATDEAFAPKLPPSIVGVVVDIGEATGKDTVL